MQTAKWSWIVGSILINITIAIYIYLSISAPQLLEERMLYMNDNWLIYSVHWRLELIFMTLIAVASVYFALQTKLLAWVVISIGQIVLLSTYPIMLGGYESTSLALATMANQIAVVIFNFGNLVFLCGCLLLYSRYKHKNYPKWMKYIGVVLSGLTASMFLLFFFNVFNFKDFVAIGLLVNMLYFLNAYFVYRLM